MTIAECDKTVALPAMQHRVFNRLRHVALSEGSKRSQAREEHDKNVEAIIDHHREMNMRKMFFIVKNFDRDFTHC